MQKTTKQARRGAATLAAVIALGAVTGGVARAASDGSKVVIQLERTESGDDDASGVADFRSAKGKSRFKVKVKRGPEDRTLAIKVGGIVRGTVTTNGGGNASVEFRSGQPTGTKLPLAFDPRGAEIEIQDGAVTVLDNVTGDGSNPPGSQIDERVTLIPTGLQPAASGHARLRERKGVRDFDVEVEDVTDGAYDLVVDGVVRGAIAVTAGRGEIEFGAPSDDADELPLDFAPLGALVQVAQGGAVVLAATMAASAPGVNVCAPSETTTLLTVAGPDADASGDARLRVRDDCERDFRVEIEDLDVGAYELWVDGVLRGTITVAVTPEGVEGELEFDTDPDDPDDVLLDFDPTGAAVEIRQGATTFLTGSAGTPGGGTCDPVDVEPDLESSGAIGGAKGKARFRQETDCDRDFRVEIEDVPLGNYELRVGGIPRGTITVALVAGEPEGDIEFDNDPDQPGELLFTFDPRGQLVEVLQGTTVVLNLVYPD